MRSGHDNNRGLYRKFKVTRTDGKSAPGKKHERCRYYVLDLDHDEFARAALQAYGLACKAKFPQLSEDLLAYARGENVFGDWCPEGEPFWRDEGPKR